ncbi:hypothetical protein [Geopseudomonas aromaticivorans]
MNEGDISDADEAQRLAQAGFMHWIDGGKVITQQIDKKAEKPATNNRAD